MGVEADYSKLKKEMEVVADNSRLRLTKVVEVNFQE